MVALKPMVNFERYGAVVTNNTKIVSFNEKKFCKNGLINGGIYMVNKNWLEERFVGKVFSFERDILENRVSKDDISYFISDTYFIDIGIPADYIRASEELPGLFL
jgi:D-glycero-alpha-D-manno-heptose 1-phosphate guanylyltransferase